MKTKILAWLAAGMLVAGASWGFETRTGAVGCGRIFVSWDEMAEDAFGRYEVYCGVGEAPEVSELGGAKAVLTIAGAGEAWRSFAHLEGLPAGTRCWARVKCVSVAGKAQWGEAVEAETLARGLPAGARATVRIPMFMYHHVMPKGNFPSGYDEGGWYSTANFERDLKYMKEHGMHTVTTSDIVNGKLPKNPIMLTFDDGYKDFQQYAVPLLKKYGFTAVNALVTRKMGGQSTWAVPEWPLGTMMTWSEAKDCLKSGMELGGHTQTHVNLYAEPDKMGEVAGCYNDLVQNVGKQLYFCYPWGMGGHDYGAGKTAVKNAGFKFATRTYPAGLGTTASDWFFFPRQFANQSDTLRAFLVKGDFDCDGDGLKDYTELDWGLDGAKADTDGDGLTDLEEAKYDGNSGNYKPYPNGGDLNATKADTDGDGLTDGEEVKTYKTNPLKADTDGDGLSDGDEVHKYGTDPLKADADRDGDGLSDAEETNKYKTDPLKADTDGDGLKDGEEVKTYKTDPLKADSDGDGLKDGEEVKTYKTKPLLADTDGDGLKDGEEVKTHKTSPTAWDTDGDGMSDGDEVNKYGTNPLVKNGRRPRSGTAIAFPGRVEAEDFDFGGEGVSFHDTTAGNAGDGKSYSDRVDVYSGGTKWAVGLTEAEEWLEYTVKVPQSGLWLLTARTSGNGSGGQFRVLFGGADKSGAVGNPSSGGLKIFQNVQTAVKLEAGTQVMRLAMVKASSGGQVGWFDYIDAQRGYLGLPATVRELGKAAQSSKQFSVTGNVPWKATTGASWLKVTGGASGTGKGTVYYDVAANTGPDREGTIKVSAGTEAYVRYTIRQAGTGPASLGWGASGREFGAGAQNSKQVAVTGNVPWTATSDVAWLKITKGASGTGKGTVYYNVEGNLGAARTGHLTLSGWGLGATYTVTQQGASGGLTLNATERTFTLAAATGKELGVTTPGAWTAKSDASWLTITKGASGTGNGKVYYNVAANKGGTRTGHITVTGGGVTATFTVKQTGVLVLGSTSRTLDAAAATWKQLAVEGSVSWTAKSDASWLKITKGASGTGNGTVYYSVTANAGGTRTGHITVTGGGVTVKFTLTQTGVLWLGSTSRTLGAAAATWKELAVEGSVSWTATSDASWLTIQKGASGTGKGTVYYGVTANTGGTRTGHVTVKGGSVTVKFTLTQTGSKAAKSAERRAEPPKIWVTTSDGSDGAAVVDGDEGTGWSPAGAEGAWVALSFEEERTVETVEVVGEGLPEGMRALVSGDADHWSEEGGEGVSYLWVILPDEGEAPTVREILTEP